MTTPSRSHKPNQIGPLRLLAKAGLSAKGFVYCLLGMLAILAALDIGGKSTRDADPNGVFRTIRGLPAGPALLLLLAVGLACYAAWRLLEAARRQPETKKAAGRWLRRLRYGFSGLTYAAFAWAAARLALSDKGNGSDKKQQVAGELLSHPAGPWLTGVIALVFAGTGIYQIWYGWSEKYRKHVPHATLQRAGKIGYTARGVVWLLIGWLFGRAALHTNAAEAGDTSRAAGLLDAQAAGPLLLAALGIGLLCYGVFNFLRAKHDRVGEQ